MKQTGFTLRLIKLLALLDTDRVEYPTTFQRELNYQSSRILLLASILMSVAWLSYIPIDMKLHPDEPLIVVFRLGLTVAGVIILFMHLTKKFYERSLLILTTGGTYFVVSTGIITGLSGGDQAYVGGYLFVLTLTAVMPLKRRAALMIILSSLVMFAAVGYFKGMHFETTSMQYSLNDLISTSIVASFFIILLDQMRFRSWQKSRQIEEQRAELKNDKTKIDKLLLNILPAKVAQELKERGSVMPEYYEQATIVFTDFVGFTKISETLSPVELIWELDKLFSEFDRVMDKYSLEKLKTIGDSYMYAGGVPVVSRTHAIDAVMAALEIQELMKRVNKDKINKNMPIFELRIGVNTGPLMAGVVGEKKFVYDVWGDAVNLANRLQSAGENGMVNISEGTHNVVSDFFETEGRGLIHVKNKGELPMYFVKRLKPELSLDDSGLCPNEKYWDRYVALVSS